MRKAIASLAVSVLLVAGASAQQFWEKKPYEKWNKNECKKMLTDSPWAQRYDIVQAVIAPLSRNEDIPTSEPTRAIHYTAQLRSALPVRQAVVQQQLLVALQKQVTPEQEQQMRRQVEEFLGVPFNDVVVVHVLYESNVPEFLRPLARYWQQQTTERVKEIVTLVTASGRRVAPIRYEVLQGAGTEFELTFPRIVDGRPLVSPGEKSFAVEFIHPAIGAGTPVAQGQRSAERARAERAVIRFNVKDMLRNGEVIY